MRASWSSLTNTLARGQAKIPALELATLPIGIPGHHPLTGARLVPAPHLFVKTEATLAETLLMARGLPAKRVILTRVEEPWGLSNEDLCGLEARL
ncbi:MAG: hypothetical protein ACUVTG_05465 [Candidatus Oleimicrobiaceae bacterium]